MAPEESVIRVNFGRPVPLFPLSAVALLPHAIIPLHIFEDRYKRMIEDMLESTGQIGLAVYSSREGTGGIGLAAEAETTDPAAPPAPPEAGEEVIDPDGTAPLRPGVCLGRILDYQRLPDGRFYIALQGVCRAKIRHELPRAPDTPYRIAMLEPIGLHEVDEGTLVSTRMRLTELFEHEPLSELREAPAFLKHMKDAAIPTSVLLELLATVFISDPEVKYKLLEGEHARTRGSLIERELHALARLIRMAEPQRRVEWPKGCSWN
jgi:Lon protease-like protein